ncbi:MAG: hypothetical protein AAF415_14685 [Pseudomonadota bacterium]
MGPCYDNAYIRELEETAEARQLGDIHRAHRHSLRQRGEGMLLVLVALMLGLTAMGNPAEKPVAPERLAAASTDRL